MKVVLLHGPAISSSRAKLIDIKKKFDPQDVVVFEEGFDVTQALGGLATLPLLSDQRLVILENPPEDLSSEALAKLDESLTLVCWFDHEIDPKKWFPAEVTFFPEGKEISAFPLLDMLASKNKNAYLELEKLKKAGYDSQYVITMVFYLLRSFIYLPTKSSQWVKKKVAKQKMRFSEDSIKDFYKFVLETDFKIKKGLLETSHAEFLLVNKFTG